MCVERTLVQTLTPFLITSNTFADIVRMAILTSLIDVDLLNRIIDSDIRKCRTPLMACFRVLVKPLKSPQKKNIYKGVVISCYLLELRVENG